MQARLFDPFSEDVVNAWLASTPVKLIYSASVFDTTLDGHARQVALVFYEEEHALGGEQPPAVEAPNSPLSGLLEHRREGSGR